MIVDTTQTKTEQEIIASQTDIFRALLEAVQDQPKLTANDPDLTIVTGLPFPYIELTTEEKKWLLKNGPLFSAKIKK